VSRRPLFESLILPSVTLWRREVVRFARQRSRVAGALGTPLVFWLLLGFGMGDSFRAGGGAGSANYLEYAYPGMLVLIVLFTSVFSSISLIEDRTTGFLQGVLVAPVDRMAIVVGKILGNGTPAVVQGLMFLLLAPLAGITLSFGAVMATVGVLAMVSLGLGATGLLFAWYMDSTQGFHAVMNLVLMPTWLLSGALFPAEGASPWLGWLMAVNPVTYCLACLRHVLYLGSGERMGGLPPLGLSLILCALFAAVLIALTARAIRKCT